MVLVLIVVGLLVVFAAAACDSDADETASGVTTSGLEDEGPESGEVVGEVGEVIKLAKARVTVNALQATFQPVMPVQRMSEQTPSAPAQGESFYQAYVRVENLGVEPVRVDPMDFTCVVDNTMVSVEASRSGPPARSLLKNTSLDLILTFKGRTGFVPELRYNPPWHQGSIRVTVPQEEQAQS